jgi:hypothetical protein
MFKVTFDNDVIVMFKVTFDNDVIVMSHFRDMNPLKWSWCNAELDCPS